MYAFEEQGLYVMGKGLAYIGCRGPILLCTYFLVVKLHTIIFYFYASIFFAGGCNIGQWLYKQELTQLMCPGQEVMILQVPETNEI